MRSRNEEEQSCLLLASHSYKDPTRPSRAELTALGIKTPTAFYHLHAERHFERGDDFNPLESASYRHHVTNPNIINRAINIPTVYKCCMTPSMKVEIIDIIVNTIEKFHWDAEKVANHIKVNSEF